MAMRFGLFGAGRVGRLHARNIADHPDAELAYVFDVDQGAARQLAGALGTEVADTSEKIWATDSVDAVLIASSTNTHVELLRGAIESRKAVYCEKPIDLNLEVVKTVAQEAHDSGIPVFMGFRRRFIPEIQCLYDGIRSGEAGSLEVIHIISRDAAPPPIPYVEVSGGFLRDKTVHYFDLLCWLTGETPIEVYANGACLVDPRIAAAGDVDTVSVTLKMPSGMLCQIQNGRRSSYGYDERIEVFGSLGMLQWNPYVGSTLSRSTESGIMLNRPDNGDGYFKQESFAAALDTFIKAVQSGSKLEPSLADGVRAQVIADAATVSLMNQQAVTISYWEPA